ncbi:MAG: hypothetical protein JWR54_1352 [Mucilaginibacter sp.]|nr:hypothetical protein [Mucilaginibacter sp.]
MVLPKMASLFLENWQQTGIEKLYPGVNMIKNIQQHPENENTVKTRYEC